MRYKKRLTNLRPYRLSTLLQVHTYYTQKSNARVKRLNALHVVYTLFTLRKCHYADRKGRRLCRMETLL